MTPRKEQIIQELIETTVNGNSIKGNETYEKMLKRITMKDLFTFAQKYEMRWDMEEVCTAQKSDFIKILAKLNY